jgi:hypothetical protein
MTIAGGLSCGPFGGKELQHNRRSKRLGGGMPEDCARSVVCSVISEDIGSSLLSFGTTIVAKIFGNVSYEDDLRVAALILITLSNNLRISASRTRRSTEDDV